MISILKRAFIILSAITIYLTVNGNAYALACRTSTGGYSDYQSITSIISIPQYEANGTVIWRGNTLETTAKCYSDYSHDDPDQVYLYVNPTNVSSGSWKIEFGINLNGVDYWQSNGKIPINGFVVPPCHSTSSCPDTVSKVITFQPIIRKKGYPPAAEDEYALFQLDGSGGLNSRGNYLFILEGLDNIRPLPCGVTVDFNPSTIDFGSMSANQNDFSGYAKPMNIYLTQVNNKSCGTKFTINGYLTTPQGLNDNMIIPEPDSGFGIRLLDENGKKIPFNSPFKLTTFEASSTDVQHILNFKAVPTVISKPIKLGGFSAQATMQISYE